MSSWEIERGDKITVVLTRNDIFPWQTGTRFSAVYRSGPWGPGDMMVVEVDGYGPVEINCNSSAFIGIYPDE